MQFLTYNQQIITKFFIPDVQSHSGEFCFGGTSERQTANLLWVAPLPLRTASASVSYFTVCFATGGDGVKEELLKELEATHSQTELSIMEMHRSVEKAAEKMETASKLTERVLAHGNGVEVIITIDTGRGGGGAPPPSQCGKDGKDH